jgi:peptidoglycan/LPS O-acetylase OafA/YrhL
MNDVRSDHAVAASRSAGHEPFHRLDIEALRGVAVTAVVLYHADHHAVPGGFIGVDVFYVISGFLITGILFRELRDSGRVNVWRFWARRARRLVPGAALVLLCTAALSLLLLSPMDLGNAGREIVAASGYVVNWLLALKSVDYLANQGQASVVLHFWSLAVEEQFYIFWPLVLIATTLLAVRVMGARDLARTLLLTVIGVAIMSFAASIYLTGTSEPFAFFSTGSRMWQLLLGGGLVLVVDRSAEVSATVRAAMSWLALAAILACAFLLSEETSYPGWAALVPTLAAASLIFAGSAPQSPYSPNRILVTPVMTFAGRISYSWYLWHWPVLIFGALWMKESGNPSSGKLTDKLVWIGLSAVLATVAYHLVENPARFNRRLVGSTGLSLAMGLGLAVAIGGVGLGLVHMQSRAEIVFSDGTETSLAAVTGDQGRLYRDGCHLDFSETISEGCVYGDPHGARTMLLYGDSHAAHWFPPLDQIAREQGWRLLARTKSSCPPIAMRVWSWRHNREYHECMTWQREVADEVRRLRPELVVLGAFSGARPQDPPPGTANDEAVLSVIRDGEIGAVKTLLPYAGRILVIRDTPWLPEEPARCLLRHPRNEDACVWRRESVSRASSYPRADLAALSPRVEIIDLTDQICDGSICPAVRRGAVVMYDQQHLTTTFSRILAPHFWPVMRRAAVEPRSLASGFVLPNRRY